MGVIIVITSYFSCHHINQEMLMYWIYECIAVIDIVINYD